jgi:hypothetical protein
VRLTELHADLVALRAALSDELLAISRIEDATTLVHDAAAREDLRRLADDRKASAAMLLRHIARLDPKFGERITAG